MTRSWYEGIAPTLDSRIYSIDYLSSSIHFRAQPVQMDRLALTPSTLPI